MSYTSGWGETLQVLIALALLGVGVWSLAAATREGITRVASPWQRWVLAAVAAAAVLRWIIAPHQLAMIFIGFKQTEHALQILPISHYGVGASAFYHALFAVLPVDHRTLMVVNAVVGVLTVPLVAAWAGRLWRDDRAAVAAAWIVALTPLFVRNDTSEANHVPALWWLLGGLVLVQTWLATGRRAALGWAVPLLALAAIARPEMPAIVALFGLVTLAGGGKLLVLRLRDPVPWALAGLLVLLCVPHTLHVANVVAWMSEGRGLPGVQADMGAGAFLEHLARTLWTEDVVLRPRLFPLGVTALALLAPLVAPRGRRLLALFALVAASGALLVYLVDLDEANIARVQVPGALLVSVVAAATVVRPSSRWRLALPALLVAALATGTPSVARLWEPTNEREEERLVERLEAELPGGDEPFTLVRLGDADRRADADGRDLTHYYFPDYLFRAPARAGLVRSVGDFLAAGDLSGPGPTYYFQGMRCFARYRLPHVPAPAGADLHPRCAAVRDQLVLEPVFEYDTPNRGDVWLEYYGDAPTLRVGLYRVTKRR